MSSISMESGVNALLKENWSWVDQRLYELYYEYGVTSDNCDDYIESGFLVERGAWVDQKLQSQFDNEFEDMNLCPASMSWVLYKESPKQYCLEEESSRSRAESDISNYSAEVENVLKRIDYCYLHAAADEVVSVSSGLAEFENCSPISACSEMTMDINDPFYDYCSEDRFKY